jgi:YgiT-type zinc finger domain-containing protein
MKCVICKQGETKPGRVTVTLTRGDATVIFKGVPAEVCENCGEYYLSDEVTDELLKRADAAIQGGSELEVLRYGVYPSGAGLAV